METPAPMPRVTRDEAIRRIRDVLVAMVDDDHSLCQVAAERGVFCHGFRRYSDMEFQQRYEWLVRRNPGLSRDQIEELANRWQLARQIVDEVPLSCDAQQLEHDICNGWDEFSNRDLEKYYRELTGTSVEVA